MRLRDRSLPWRLALAPHRYLGEAYVDGTLAVEGGTVRDLLDLCGKNLPRLSLGSPAQAALERLEGLLRPPNHVARACRNVAHHYDLEDVLYELFLDRDRQYSCAYFSHPEMTLDEAPEAACQRRGASSPPG